MSRVIFFLLSCFITLAVVVQGFQKTADHPDAQCVNSGYVASCDNFIWNNGELNCTNIECIGQQNRAVSIGPAVDGTVCNENDHKICSAGRCMNVPRGQRMPKVVGENEFFYLCSRITVNPRRRPGTK